MGRKYLLALLVLGLLIITAFSGCIDTDMVTEDFSGEYNANENTTLSVENSNGYIKINTYNGDTVKLDGEKRVSENRKEELDKTEIEVTEENNEIIIETIYEDPQNTHVRVNMDIMVPDYVNVESVQSSNGDITIRDVEGYVSAESSNGDVEVRGTTGISGVSSSNGDLIVEVFDFVKDINTSSSNGDVIVYILPTLNATIDLQTSNGDASVSGVTLDKTLDQDKHVTGTLNGGGYKINIHSSNGNVELKKLNA
ncbi:MAG: hypothetical protein JSV09_03120 [Thermoplasmata archaeon]|nr:MAG: hypothetical protein JSV09_03120 [Thermoplasmata archaeon]